MRCRTSILIAALSALVLVGLAGPGLAGASGEMNLTFVPAPGQSTASTGYFVFEAAPGSEYTQVFSLRNDGKKTIRVQLAAVDASTATSGGVSFALPAKKLKETGAWISLEKTSYLLSPGESVETRTVTKVPRDATPGDHLAGVAAWVPATKKKATEPPGGQASTSIVVQSRVVVAVQPVVPGAAEPVLEIVGVAPAVRPSGMFLEIGIDSTGGKLTSGSGTVELPASGFKRDFTFGTFVPGTSTEYPIEWDAAPSAGAYDASVTIRYGQQGEKTAEWNGSFKVADKDLADLEDRFATPENTASGSTKPWLVYGLIGGLALVVLIMALALFRRRPAPRR